MLSKSVCKGPDSQNSLETRPKVLPRSKYNLFDLLGDKFLLSFFSRRATSYWFASAPLSRPQVILNGQDHHFLRVTGKWPSLLHTFMICLLTEREGVENVTLFIACSKGDFNSPFWESWSINAPVERSTSGRPL